jgi:hypothetical protein
MEHAEGEHARMLASTVIMNGPRLFALLLQLFGRGEMEGGMGPALQVIFGEADLGQDA